MFVIRNWSNALNGASAKDDKTFARTAWMELTHNVRSWDEQIMFVCRHEGKIEALWFHLLWSMSIVSNDLRKVLHAFYSKLQNMNMSTDDQQDEQCQFVCIYLYYIAVTSDCD
jgi:hypothetical protein